jgi:hypothetical protein
MNQFVCLNEFLSKKTCTLLEMQKLHGKINDFAQMCPFIKGFRYHQNKLLQEFELKQKNIFISNDLKKELEIWKNCIADSYQGFPIPKIVEEIPIFYVENYSDAAGAAFCEEGGNIPIKDERGAASITIVKIKFTTVQCVTGHMN